MKKPELLAPAGNLEKLKIALLYGADAVYMGGRKYSLRAINTFSDEEIVEGIRFAHSLNKKAYITVNIFPHNEDLIDLPEYISFIADNNADGIILSDPGVFYVVKNIAPHLPIHLSTQANTTNWASVRFWEEQGVQRIVLARELSFSEISDINTKTNVELEAFIHGAMCISYSGRCLLSNYLTGRDSNRGECAQPCRWKYAVVEEKRPNQFFSVEEDASGSYVFNSKDLCLLPYLPEMMQCGINSFKIEGRMKSVHYVATVVKVYREAIDMYWNNPDNYVVRAEWLSELDKISHRAYTSGFYLHKTNEDSQIYTSSSYMQTHDFVGLVKEYYPETGIAVIEQRNNIKIGELIEVLQPGKEVFEQHIHNMFNEEGDAITVAPHPQQTIKIPMAQAVQPYAMIRRRVNSGD